MNWLENFKYRMRTQKPKQMQRLDNNTYYGGNLGGVTITKKRKKPYKWVSPRGAGNMTVMPGDPEMVFFAPIAAGAGIAASPIITSTVGSAMSGINTAGDALAATAAGQRLTSGLNFVTNAIGRSKAWPWIDAGLTSIFGAHGIDKVASGDIHNVGDVVETGLDLLPLAQLARPIVSTVSRVGNTIKKTTPQITADNVANITPAQWTAAQDAAIARGDMAEAQRLRELHFKTKASKNKLIDGNGNPVAVKHHGNVWNVFDPDRTMSGTLWTANEDAFKLDDIMTFPASDLPTEWKNLYINMENPIQDEVGIGTTRMLSEIRKGSKDAIKESIRDYGVSNPDGVFKRIKITEDFLKKNGYDLNDPEIRKILNNPEFYGKEPTMAATAYPNNIKSADAVTYDDKGVRIPLGERDNFKLNDIRYSWLAPFIGLGTLGTLSNRKQQ